MKQPKTAGLGKQSRPGRFAKALRATPAALELFRGFGSGFFSVSRSVYVDGAYLEAKSATYAHIYASQDNVRTVVDAIARVAADHALKFYERQDDGQREEDSDHPAAATLREPNDWMSTRELVETMCKDKLVYDDAYLWDLGGDANGTRFLVRVPPHAMQVGSNNRLRPSSYRVTFQDGTWIDLAPEEVIHWRGYSAGDNRLGVPPAETLRSMIAETAVRQAQSVEQVKGGLVKGGIITRPPEAPQWTEEAMERFSESFASRLRGVIRGETPVLEEGMEFHEAGITPREAEMLANRKFALETVANLYGVHPSYFTTSGSLDAARRQMEEDVVTPLLGRFAETLTHQLVRGIYDDRNHFFRFRERKQTDLSKLFEAGSKATGGSTLTPNEFREDYLDKPKVPGGDKIVSHPGSQGGGTPAAPESEARGRPPNEEDSVDEAEKSLRAEVARLKRGPFVETKAELSARRAAQMRRRDKSAADHAELVRNHFRRQAKSSRPLTDEQWNRELAADLLGAALLAVKQEGGITATRLMGSFDMSQVQNYLRAGAKAVAEAINMQTVKDYEAAVEAATGKADGVREEVLEGAVSGRSDEIGMTRATALMGFAVNEAGKQNPTEHGPRVKQWVWSGSANSRHGGVAGEEIPVFSEFSNGAQFPGDAALGIEGTANCKCALDVY